MADLGTKQNWLVSPNAEVEKRWVQVEIQQRKSRIVKIKQDIEDLMLAAKVKLEAQIMMLEMEIRDLESKQNTVDV